MDDLRNPEQAERLAHDAPDEYLRRREFLQRTALTAGLAGLASVLPADTLVADLMQRLASSFAEERKQLENQWDQGDDVSTEDLRVALTRYRSFFERLLSA